MINRPELAACSASAAELNEETAVNLEAQHNEFTCKLEIVESDGFTYPVVQARLIQLLLENHAPISLPTCVHVL